MQIATLRLLITLVFTLGLWAAPTWANHDGQEDICHSAAVIFCDNFEARTLGDGDFQRATYKNNGWEYCCIQGTSVVTTAGVTGASTKALQLHQVAGANVGGSYINGKGVGNILDVYFRWYVKWSSNFVFSPTGNKHAGGLYGPSNAGINMMNQFGAGSAALMYFPQGVTPPSGACILNQPAGTHAFYICQTMNVTPFVAGQWYCVEVHAKLNTVGNENPTSDGIAEAWINGAKVITRTDLNIERTATLATADRYFKGVSFYARWQCSGSGGVVDGPFDPVSGGQTCVCVNGPGTCTLNTHPAQDRWHDNIVVSSQRIGCIGGTPPPGDTTPPTAPGNLRISSLWDQLLKVVWTLQ